MAVYLHKTYSVFFGDLSTAIDPAESRGKVWQDIEKHEPFEPVKELVGARFIAFSHQVHGVEGRVITDLDQNSPLFFYEGDYLITTQTGIGLGVATADCLSIVIIAQSFPVVAVIHAGWRGLIGGIVMKVIDRIHTEYGVAFADIKLIIGPAARVCCFEVAEDFLELHKHRKEVFDACRKDTGRLFFDAQLFLLNQCRQKGLSDKSLDFSYHDCTICEPIYCSYRREKKSPLRQLTVVSLK